MEQSKRRKTDSARSKPEGSPRRLSIGLLLVGGVSLTLVVIALVLVVASGNEQPARDGPEYSGIPAAWQNRNVLGDPDALVTVQAWEDFRCPACAAFNQRVKPDLVADYVASGSVKLEFRHFPLQQHEPGASLAALASECAADQGFFWSYHDRVFQETSAGPPAFIAERLIDYAVELNLDKSMFTECLMSQTHLSAITVSLQAARTAGLNSTPSVLVDGLPIDNPIRLCGCFRGD